MFSRFIVLAALISLVSTPGRSQDSPSLGDLARQLRNQKSDAQPKRVVTNDSLSHASAVNILGLDDSGAPAGPAGLASDSSASASLARWESVVKTIAAMDRATLTKEALQGAAPDFAGHSNWEDRLFAAKQTYVSNGLDCIQRARQLLARAQTLKSSQVSAEDPRMKDLEENLKGLIRDAIRADAEFQAVILEGRDLAHQAAH